MRANCWVLLAMLCAVVVVGPAAAAAAQTAAQVGGKPASVLPNLNKLTDAEKAAGWKLLFDGKTTAGWRNFRKQDISRGWQVIDGALCRVDKSAGDIITTEQYDNFVLELDYKVPPHANSGIMYRVSEDEARAPFTGVEYQILDNTDPKGDPQKSGWAYALYQPPLDPKTGKPLDATRPVGQWNHVKLVLQRPARRALDERREVLRSTRSAATTGTSASPGASSPSGRSSPSTRSGTSPCRATTATSASPISSSCLCPPRPSLNRQEVHQP